MICARACLGSPLRGRHAPKSAHGLPSGRSLYSYSADSRREKRFQKRQGDCDGQHQRCQHRDCAPLQEVIEPVKNHKKECSACFMSGRPTQFGAVGMSRPCPFKRACDEGGRSYAGPRDYDTVRVIWNSFGTHRVSRSGVSRIDHDNGPGRYWF